jgi:hypothetical protein
VSIQIDADKLSFRPQDDQAFRRDLAELCSEYNVEWGDGTDAEDALAILKGVSDELDYCEGLQSRDVNALVDAIKDAVRILEGQA